MSAGRRKSAAPSISNRVSRRAVRLLVVVVLALVVVVLALVVVVVRGECVEKLVNHPYSPPLILEGSARDSGSAHVAERMEVAVLRAPARHSFHDLPPPIPEDGFL